MEQEWRCSDHWSPPQWVHFVSWFQQHQWISSSQRWRWNCTKNPPVKNRNQVVPVAGQQLSSFPVSFVSSTNRQILFGEFEFSPTPETVSVAFGIKEDDPVKEWGSTNAENKANYGGASAWNLKKPAMQQDDETEKLVGWLVGARGQPPAGVNLHRWGQSCMGGGKQFMDFGWWKFHDDVFFKSFTVYTWKFLDFKSD